MPNRAVAVFFMLYTQTVRVTSAALYRLPKAEKPKKILEEPMQESRTFPQMQCVATHFRLHDRPLPISVEVLDGQDASMRQREHDQNQ
jgi:hypothetical protein